MELVGGVANLPELLRARARDTSVSIELTEKLISALPAPLAVWPAFLDRMSHLWRYDPGTPVTVLPNGQVATGTHLWPEVNNLFAVLKCVVERLHGEKLITYLRRLSDAVKHHDTLYECCPVIRSSPEDHLEFEVTGFGEGNHTVDWLITTDRGTVAVEVKNRIADLIESLDRGGSEHVGWEGTVPAPTHDVLRMLRGIDRKYRAREASDVIQAVWIHTDIAQEEHELAVAVSSLDPSRIHAVILGDFDDGAFIVARTDEIKCRVASVLRLTESRRFVFSRNKANLT